MTGGTPPAHPPRSARPKRSLPSWASRRPSLLANPANIVFDVQEGALLVTNHASLVPHDPNLFVVFDVSVDDKGQPLP